jgi:hypothetical protein
MFRMEILLEYCNSFNESQKVFRSHGKCMIKSKKNHNSQILNWLGTCTSRKSDGVMGPNLTVTTFRCPSYRFYFQILLGYSDFLMH